MAWGSLAVEGAGVEHGPGPQGAEVNWHISEYSNLIGDMATFKKPAIKEYKGEPGSGALDGGV